MDQKPRKLFAFWSLAIFCQLKRYTHHTTRSMDHAGTRLDRWPIFDFAGVKGESLPLKYRNPDDGYHRLACFGLDGFGRLSQLYRSELHAMGLAVANTLRAWEDYMSGALALTAASMESFHCTGSGDRAVRLRVFA